MSLKPCADCQKPISPFAAFCPRCGRPGDGTYPVPTQVTDIDMKFGSMVTFMVKATVAAIPALLILAVLALLLGGVFGALLRH